MAGDLPAGAFDGAGRPHRQAVARQARVATRMSGTALAALVPAIPEMVGGSADLTGSNFTIRPGMTAFTPPITPAATSTMASASTAWRRP